MGGFLSSRLFGYGAAAGLVIMAVLYAYALLDNRHLNRVNSQLDARITDPVTGYERRVAQANTNVENLKVAIERQTAEWKTQSAAAAATLAETQRRLDNAQAATKKAEARSAVLLSRPPVGDTLEARIKDVDARILESLK